MHGTVYPRYLEYSPNFLPKKMLGDFKSKLMLTGRSKHFIKNHHIIYILKGFRFVVLHRDYSVRVLDKGLANLINRNQMTKPKMFLRYCCVERHCCIYYFTYILANGRIYINYLNYI